eukprot:TRINITY_DN2710_c0_g1_i5.p1 TRINITY_DN2710_c0_g1~~TRINITY_DN2710_c0_g1_i5.p1  ORF type:complete len:702 (-),score=177.91 TRINITY_DN2710_c0_g1_i5:138-2243(-)
MGKKMDYYLISRRSAYRAGTRFNARGIDDNGNVANFVETEQIIGYNGMLCSHVQVRGSVPVFWGQRGITATVRITRNYEYTNSAFLKHIDYLNANYGKVLAVNLMSLTKSGEQMITDAFEEHVKRNDLPTLRYEFFDFHYACRNRRFDRVNPLIKKLFPVADSMKFTVEDKANSYLITQKGIIRTNCVDCLDRTNVCQSKIALKMIESMMRSLGVDLAAAFGQDVLGQIDNNNPKQQHPFILNFKVTWADNGDTISRHYSGTGSTHSSVTRYGKGGLMGLLNHGMTTLNRFYIGNWEDQTKQECIDMVLGEHTETINLFGESLERELKLREREFASFEKISVFTATWNVGSFTPPASYDLRRLLDFEGQPPPDLVVICLQEIIDVNPKNVLVSTNEPTIQLWVNVLTDNLRRVDKGYSLLQVKDFVGILLLTFANDRAKTRVSRVNSESLRAGLLNKIGGTKGAVVTKLYFDDSSLAFINAYLPGDENNLQARVNTIDDIHRNAFQSEALGKKKEEKIETLDYKFFLGDHNFQLACSNAEARQLIENFTYAMANRNDAQAADILFSLFNHDEMTSLKKNSEYLSKYKEGNVTFLPTYKYDIGTQTYDSSKKPRVPGWGDRILFWHEENAQFEQKFYDRREILDTEHRPVVALFELEVKKVAQEKKEEITKQIYEALNSKPMEEDNEETTDMPELKSENSIN